MSNVRLSLNPINLECNLFQKYNLRSLGITSKGDLKQASKNFLALNSPDKELPEVVTDTAIEERDIYDIEIVISSDEEFDSEADLYVIVLSV